MKIAVLCNGPSKDLYNSPEKYGYVIGCNIPWTKVDATIVLDIEVVRKWAREPELITVPAVFSRKAWMETDGIMGVKREFFRPYLIEIVDPLPSYDSSGHHAVKYALRKGATEIDIYGCDSWWKDTISSHTHKYITTGKSDANGKISGWRKRWKEIIESNPSIKINFIGEPK